MMRLVKMIFAAALLSGAAGADAAVITFDNATGLSSDAFDVTGSEDGFDFGAFSGSLYLNFFGNPDRNMEGYSEEGGGVLTVAKTGGGLFRYGGTDFAAYSGNGTGSQTLVITGLVGGSVVGSASYELANTSFAIPGYANWTSFGSGGLAGIDVDELRFALVGGIEDFAQVYVAVDNIQLGVAGVIPEPDSWALLIAGFGFIGAAMRRRRIVQLA